MADIGLGFRVSYTLWGSSVRSIKRVGSGSEGGAAHGQTLPGGGGKRSGGGRGGMAIRNSCTPSTLTACW